MKIETTLDEMKRSYDWKEAFEYADPTKCEGASCSTEGFDCEDVEEVLASSDGENDERDWIAIFKLKDGRYAFLSAGCDFTGWDCASGGQAWVAEDLERLTQFGMGNVDRARLEVP